MVSSLKNLCRVPGLVEISNHPHIKKEIFSLPINFENFTERNDAVQRALSEFLKDINPVVKWNIPRHFIFFIGIEMWKWATYVLKYFDLSFKFSESFIQSSLFTSDGLIDDEKAARKLLKEQSFSIVLKYNIACQYFLEDIIPGLWKMLQKEPNYKDWLKEHDPESPMVMWYDYLEKINSKSVVNRKSITRYFKKRVFLYGLRERNVAAVKYSYGPKGGPRKTKREVKVVRKIVYKPYCQYVRRAVKRLQGNLYIRWVLCIDDSTDGKIILHFLSLMNKRELKEFFLHFPGSICFVTLFLFYPFQHKFMDFAHIIFENFDAKVYKRIMIQIISLSRDKYTRHSYDYHQLLRDFWIKTPANLKEQVIRSETVESDLTCSLVYKMFTKPNFTVDDLTTFNLILKNSNFIDRKNILLNRANEMCLFMILINKNFRLADLFLKSLNLDHELLHTFKKDYLHDHFSWLMKKQSIELFEEFFKWVVGSDEIDDFKSEIFHQWTRSEQMVINFFLELKEEIPFSFLNKLLKWFQKTDAEIEEWNQNIEYSPLINYSYDNWFDQLLLFRGHSYERIIDIKRDLLLERFSEIARMSLNLRNVTGFLDTNIFVLCSYKKEKYIEFIEYLRSFYDDSIKQKICLLCLNKNFVRGIGEEEELNCELHGTNGLISLEKVDEICSSFLQRLDLYLKIHELRVKRN